MKAGLGVSTVLYNVPAVLHWTTLLMLGHICFRLLPCKFPLGELTLDTELLLYPCPSQVKPQQRKREEDAECLCFVETSRKQWTQGASWNSGQTVHSPEVQKTDTWQSNDLGIHWKPYVNQQRQKPRNRVRNVWVYVNSRNTIFKSVQVQEACPPSHRLGYHWPLEFKLQMSLTLWQCMRWQSPRRRMLK